MNRSGNRSGFTLLELVVVLGILAVLAGLSLGAIQRARESANRASCANNLRQIGLALTQYHNDNGSLPPGISRKWETHFLTWRAFIVPYLEQESLAQEIRDAMPQFHMGNVPAFMFGTVIPPYGCPSDAFAKTPHNFLAPTGVGMVSYSSYLGVHGRSAFRIDGCLYDGSSVRETDIRDGTSNTLLVGERPSAIGPLWPPCDSVWYTGVWSLTELWEKGGVLLSQTTCSTTLGVRDVIALPVRGCERKPSHFGPGRLGEECDIYHFWSLHGGGSNFLFADGSVRFLSYASDAVLPALASRAGGEIVDAY